MRSMPSILGLAIEGHHHVHELTRTVSNDSARRSPAGLLPPWVFSQWCEDHGPYQPMRFDLILKQGVSFHVRVAEGDGLPMLGLMRQEVRWQ